MNKTLLTKQKEFFRIADALNRNLNCRPILYGSLGLAFALEKSIDTNDIDILIEQSHFDHSLDKVHQILSTLGYRLVDEEENEFVFGDYTIGIAGDGDLARFAGIQDESIQQKSQPVHYRSLSPAQYLSAYRASETDGYRRDVRAKNDQAKIAMILEAIAQHD